MKRTPRDTFLALIRAAGIEAYDRIQQHVDEQAANLRAQALESIQSALSPQQAQRRVTAPKKISRAAPKQLADGKAKKGAKKCSKCGAVGFYASSCGKTHDADGAIEQPDGEEDDEPEAAEPAPPPKRKGAGNLSPSAYEIIERTRRARSGE